MKNRDSASMFRHEKMDCYRLALEVALWARSQEFQRGDAELKNQMTRASSSVVLNIAEGRSRSGKAGLNHYRIAYGSAAETCAALDLLDLPRKAEMQHKLRRVGMMLSRMAG